MFYNKKEHLFQYEFGGQKLVQRTILHSDLNNCYASVESLFHPEYREIPMAVGGETEKRHGIILAKNEHAKK